MGFRVGGCSVVQNLEGVWKKKSGDGRKYFWGLGNGSCFPARLGRVHLAVAARPERGDLARAMSEASAAMNHLRATARGPSWWNASPNPNK